MKFAILVIFGLVFTAIPLIQPSFGHGVGGETLPPVQISGKNATLSLFINPPTYDPKTGEYEILLKLYETNTQAVIPHVTYLVQMSHDGKQLFSERFHDDSSNLSIKVVPKNTNSIKIDGSNYGELGWSSNIISPLKIEGPIFLSGGLYKFHIEVLTIGTDSNKLNPPTKFDA
ncbi:MAG: peptidase, partial [Nitrososphaeria archaeon]|nr:peptidase [Nitrososphaeria archaeon]NDB51956.1 peptidase [Nitrosopumilaceae archaeon]NDB90753.1 peptidase [Nitrososphaerota archaeon]